jgi:hypothetical protein
MQKPQDYSAEYLGTIHEGAVIAMKQLRPVRKLLPRAFCIWLYAYPAFLSMRRILRVGIERVWLRLRSRQRRMFGLRPFAAKS